VDCLSCLGPARDFLTECRIVKLIKLITLISLTTPNKNLDEVNRKNESVSYGVAVYIGTLSFLWDVSYRWVRILVGRIFAGDALFNFSSFD